MYMYDPLVEHRGQGGVKWCCHSPLCLFPLSSDPSDYAVFGQAWLSCQEAIGKRFCHIQVGIVLIMVLDDIFGHVLWLVGLMCCFSKAVHFSGKLNFLLEYNRGNDQGHRGNWRQYIQSGQGHYKNVSFLQILKLKLILSFLCQVV